jgi:HSP20 family protein
MSNFRWNSLEELVAIQEKMNRLFEETLYRREFADDPTAAASRWVPAADAYESDREIVFHVEVPGVSLDDVRLEADGGRLRVSGTRPEAPASQRFLRMERVCGEFTREFALPAGVDTDGITANLDNGILRVRVPKPARRSGGP